MGFGPAPHPVDLVLEEVLTPHEFTVGDVDLATLRLHLGSLRGVDFKGCPFGEVGPAVRQLLQRQVQSLNLEELLVHRHTRIIARFPGACGTAASRKPQGPGVVVDEVVDGMVLSTGGREVAVPQS